MKKTETTPNEYGVDPNEDGYIVIPTKTEPAPLDLLKARILKLVISLGNEYGAYDRSCNAWSFPKEIELQLDIYDEILQWISEIEGQASK